MHLSSPCSIRLTGGSHHLVQASPVISCQDNHNFSLLSVQPLLPPTVHSADSNQRLILKAYWIGSPPLSGNLARASYHTCNKTQASPLSSQAPNHLACPFLSLYLKPLSACSPHPSCIGSSLPDLLQPQDFLTRCGLGLERPSPDPALAGSSSAPLTHSLRRAPIPHWYFFSLPRIILVHHMPA